MNRRRKKCLRRILVGLEFPSQPAKQLHETAVDIVAKFLAVFVNREYGIIVTRRKNPAVSCLVPFGVPGPDIDTTCAGSGMFCLTGPMLLKEGF